MRATSGFLFNYSRKFKMPMGIIYVYVGGRTCSSDLLKGPLQPLHESAEVSCSLLEHGKQNTSPISGQRQNLHMFSFDWLRL